MLSYFASLCMTMLYKRGIADLSDDTHNDELLGLHFCKSTCQFPLIKNSSLNVVGVNENPLAAFSQSKE